MSFKIQPATRVGVKPLIAIYSESGGGKTYSGLLLARGLAGPKGKIVVADSESGRASLYADVIPGGFRALDFEPPFSPARYIEAIDAIEKEGADVGIIDSGSHEWEGIGGVLSMQGALEEKSGKPGLHTWRMPKLEHAKFIQRLVRTRIPLIVCLRAKYRSRQVKDDKGKTEIVRDDYLSPLQSEEFIFEATVHFWIDMQHGIHLTKCSHPALRDCFPKAGPITIEHGEKLAEWCVGTTATKGKPAAAAPALDERPTGPLIRHKLLVELRDITSELHGWRKGLPQSAWEKAKVELQKWLTNQCGIKKTLEQMTVEELATTVEQVRYAIKTIPK